MLNFVYIYIYRYYNTVSRKNDFREIYINETFYKIDERNNTTNQFQINLINFTVIRN